MADMGRYCKAYVAKAFQAYDGWEPKLDQLRARDDGDRPTELADDHVLYVQENFVVTDDVFLDEHIVFDDVNDDWKAYCRDQLEFSVPDTVAST